MYHHMAATLPLAPAPRPCPSDMVERVRKVLANRGLLCGCVV